MDACCRHDHMYVGMIIQFSGLGMQYRCKSGDTLQLLVILRKCFQKFLYALKHQSIDGLLILLGQLAQLFGQGKGDQEILGWKLFVQLIFNPLPAFMVLAMGAASMATGMRDIGLFLTAGTPDKHVTIGLFSTLLHGP
jgi:hypothetical protein